MIQNDLKQLMNERGYSQTAVARNLGISTAALSQWLAGDYSGRSEKIAAAVDGFLQRERERRAITRLEIDFLYTDTARRILEVCRMCHLDGEIGLITGEAGNGKTTAVKEYARQNSDVVLIEADLGYSARVLFKELHRKTGHDGEGILHDMFEDVVDKLNGSGRLIIVDEAEHLPTRALDLLRRINDKTGVGIVLIGLPRLVEQVTKKRGDYAYLYSRIGMAARVFKLTEEDVKLFVEGVFPGANGMCKSFGTACGGSARILVKLLRRAKRLTQINNAQLTRSLVDKAAEMLLV